MISTDALYLIADAAEEAGNYELARQSFERGAALGDGWCLFALAHMYDVGGLGVPVDKVRAMQFYRRAWRKRCPGAANNIAVLYREQGNHRTMFQWFKREAETYGDSTLELAKCYLSGTGVRKCTQTALRYLATTIRSECNSEWEREEAHAILETLRPRSI